jgi:hypothetical protein
MPKMILEFTEEERENFQAAFFAGRAWSAIEAIERALRSHRKYDVSIELTFEAIDDELRDLKYTNF